jgi:hypothetical protein
LETILQEEKEKTGGQPGNCNFGFPLINERSGIIKSRRNKENFEGQEFLNLANAGKLGIDNEVVSKEFTLI